ncbi:MAG: N-acyl homoserine lactonase family protein [Burkholderiaceae bacterium]|nr:N-acyl homoserine lactonase family protein [Burkholderiaceae bacterium]
MNDDLWEAVAIRYATVERRLSENFIFCATPEGEARMDYFVWLLTNGNRAILVDTGFNEQAARERKRNFLACPIRSLETLDVTAADVEDVVITHAHYDHAGNLGLLPRARFHLQEREMQFATGAPMRHRVLRHSYCVDDVCSLVRLVYADRVVFHDGDYDLAPGVSVHLVGGHTHGLQIVRVRTSRGYVVLASDASHYLENLRARSPFPIVSDVAEMLRGYERIEALADSPDHIVPGHDPLVMQQYRRLPLRDGVQAVSLTEPIG